MTVEKFFLHLAWNFFHLAFEISVPAAAGSGRRRLANLRGVLKPPEGFEPRKPTQFRAQNTPFFMSPLVEFFISAD